MLLPQHRAGADGREPCARRTRDQKTGLQAVEGRWGLLCPQGLASQHEYEPCTGGSQELQPAEVPLTYCLNIKL